jgi:phosphatidate cytidylyltransferase
MTNHAKRIFTGVIGVLLLVAVICFAPAWVFTFFILFAALLSLNEFYAMASPDAAQPIVFANYLCTAGLFCSLLVKGPFYIAIIPLFIILPLALFMARYRKRPPTMGEIGRILMGPFYVCLPLMLLVLIYGLPRGQWWVLFILAVIFAGDTGSFYVGRSAGKHKLSRISPGKTWEGAIGGLLSNIAAGGIYGYLFFPSFSVVSVMLLAIALGISGQIGDLTESMLKRISKAKESGTVLPGHGGLLDRIDSLLFSIPILFLYLGYVSLAGYNAPG